VASMREERVAVNDELRRILWLTLWVTIMLM
jgi:hypothetical protein